MKENLELCWMTNEGCEWINRSFVIEYETSQELEGKIKSLVDAYYKNTLSEAAGLQDHWSRHEEYVDFGMFGRMEDHKNELILYGVLDKYDDLENETTP